ncbi:MAG: amino acid adenylation domain-containing protein, partial [Thermoanaerobaculia bacterium]
YAAPRNELEAALAGIWQSVLGVERIGIHDDFFDLGGHSLKTIQVRSRIRHQLGADLPLRSLFDHPTVADLASEVRRALGLAEGKAGRESIPRLPDAESYALSHAQRRLWLWQRMNPGDVAYNMPALYLLQGGLERNAFHRAFQELVERHAALRTSFASVDGEPVQRIAPGTAVRLDVVDLSALPAEARDAAAETLVREDVQMPFDLRTPPVRARLLVLGADRQLFLLTLHHILSDAWSWAAIGRDLAALYGALAAGGTNPLPPLPIRYVDYAAWENERIGRGDLERAEQHWLRKLQGELPILDLPTDHPRPAAASLRGGRRSARMDADLAGSLRRLGRDNDLTLFMTLLAATTAFLSRLTGQTDIILGTPSGGRDPIETEGLVGFFVNLLALRSDLTGDPTFLDLLGRSRQILLEAYAHQEYPFDLLVQKLNPVRELGRAPVFSATLVVHETTAVAPVGGLVLQPRDVEAEQAMPFDLSLLITGRDEDLGTLFFYSRDLFAPETVETWLRRFHVLLRGAAADPGLRLSGLPFWTPEECAELTLQRVPAGGSHPLSFPQRDIWFQCQLHPGTPHYNCCLEAELHGPLEPEALRRALQAVVDRHEGLRASFPGVDGRPVQRVAAELAVELDQRDFSGSAPERMEGWRAGLCAAPFDLEAGPLLRFGLVRLGPAEHRLLLVIHHLIVDAVNLVLFLEQALDGYGEPHGEDEPLPRLAVHYPDFAAWQGTRLRLGALAAQKDHWRRRLRGGLPGLELPLDRPRPAQRSFAAGEVFRRLPPERLGELKRLRTDLGTSLFRTVLSALELLLSRLTGETDLVVATPVSIRPPGLEEVVGYFANAIPLRIDMHGDPSFRQVAERVDEAVREAVRHGDYPIDEAIASFQLERDASRPLLPVCVSQVRSFDGRRGALAVRSGNPWSPGIVFDLWVLVGESSAGLELHVKYNRDLFDRATLERLADGLDTLLEDASARPDARLSELRILTPVERQRLLVGFNHAVARRQRDRFAEQQIAERAGERPWAVAAVCGDQQVPYGELDAWANRIAHRLRSLGIGREDRVALFGERGLELLAAMLGILKSGAAFLPLDPGQPDARLHTILRSAGVRAIACQASVAGRGADLAGASPSRPGVVPTDLRALAAQPDSDPGCVHGASDLACIFYTSGSTGTPKGAMVEHGGMLNHLSAKIELLELGETSAVAQNASHGFDIWVWQALAPLMVGGRVVIYPDAVASDPQALLPALKSDGVTVLETVPSFLDAMLQVPLPGGLPRLAHLVSNAETLPVALCRRWFARFPHVALINTYGATECSDDTTHHMMREPPAEGAWQVPVGRPIPGLAIYVVDPHLQPLPAGWPGQIAMAGVGLGRGYLGDPEKTARVFVPEPLGSAPGGRLYLTGDLGCWTGEGVLEFLGRRDRQVKIRGFRIELGEIEAALGRHPAIAEAAVLVRSTSGTQRLIAYAVPRPGETCDVAELRRTLAETLPEYMVPGTFVLLPAMPRTPTGKLDRKALPEPEGPAPGGSSGFAAPRTPAEELLAAIWAGVLGLGRVGIHDRFFDLGGDSILSIQVVSRARQAGLEITPRQLFQHQTVAELAAVARPAAAGAGTDSSVEGNVPLTPIQRWFFEQDNPEPGHWNMALLFEVTEPMEPRRLDSALERLVAHHDALRLRFVRDRAGWRQLNAGSETHRFFSHVDLSGLPAAQRGPALATQAARLQKSLDLAAGPLVRVVYFDAGAGDSPRLLLIVHHLAVDVVSWRILLEDLLAAYGQLGRGEAVRLGARTTSYQRWSELLSEHARSAEMRRELAYWLDRPPRICPLPVDRRDGRCTEGSFRHLAAGLGPEETRALLRDLPARHQVSMEGILLAALAEALSRATGERTLLVELASHGREEIFAGVDLTRTVGWFTCSFPLRIDLRRAATVEEAVRCAGEQLRRVPNRGLGYGLLRYLSADPEVGAQLRALPRAEVAFEYLGQLDAALPESCPLRPAKESAGPLLNPAAPISQPLGVTARVEAGCLEVVWSYSENRFQRSTVEALARDFIAVLQALLHPGHWRAAVPGGASPQTLTDLLRAAATAAPDDPFLLAEGGAALSFADFDHAARRFAAGLLRLGLARGQRVAILMENRPEFLAAMFGSLLAGAVYVAVNTHLTPEEAAYVVAHVGATVLVTEPRHLALAAAIRPACLDLEVVISAPAGQGMEDGGDPLPHPELGAQPLAQFLGDAIDPGSVDVQPGDLATIQYTSGTTARPKGVMLTHQALLTAVRERAHYMRYGPDDTMLVVNPLFHLNGQGSVVGCLLARARVVLRGKFHASQFWEDVERFGVTTLNGMQTIPRILLAREPRPGDRQSPLRTVVGILSADLHEVFEERFGVRFVEVYSLTEDPLSVMGPRDGLPPEWRAKRGAAGLPLAPESHRIRIVDDDGRDLPAGMRGEIVKRSPAMMLGYFRDAAATALALRDGWLYTGDCGFLDEDGFLHFAGRKKDAIRRSGEMISAAEIEEAIASHPGIAEVAVVGVPDPIRSEEVKAFVVLAEGYSADSLPPERIFAHCAERLAPFKVPRYLEYRRELPRTATLKIQKEKLRACAAGSVFDREQAGIALGATAARGRKP